MSKILTIILAANEKILYGPDLLLYGIAEQINSRSALRFGDKEVMQLVCLLGAELKRMETEQSGDVK